MLFGDWAKYCGVYFFYCIIRYRPIPEDILLRAFEVLDPAKRGFLSKDELIKYMTEEGEPFSQEEMEELLSAAIDPESNSIHYKDYIIMMVIDEN